MMIRLIIFAVTMLLLSSICNGQGKTSFGAGRAQDTSLTVAQVKLTAYGGSLDTMLMILMPNGDVKKVAKNHFGSTYLAGFGLNLTGNTFFVDSSEITTQSHLSDTLQYYPYVLNIESFGADTTNDATAAIQAAINYLAGVEETYNAGNVTLDSVRPPRSGVVYVPAKRYKLLRGLVKNVTGTLGTRYVNSQLYIPLVTRLDTNDRRQLITIKIQGETPPDFMANYLNRLYWAQSNKEPVLHSLISNDGSTFPAVIRAVPDSIQYLGSTLVNNLTEWHLENITVRVHSDTANGGTQLCGVDFYNTMNQTCRYFRIDTDVDNWYSVQPTRNVFGIRSGVWGTGNTMVYEEGLITGGFKWAAVGYEHSIWRNVVSLCNYYAFESATANYAAVLDDYGMFGNKYLIHAGDFKITAAATENKIRALIRVESNTLGKWYDKDASYDIVDSLNKIVGPIEWYITTGTPIDTIRVKGGANIQLEYKSSTTTGTAKYKFPNDVRWNMGGNNLDILMNGNGATASENGGVNLIGNGLGLNLNMKNNEPTGFCNLIMENDRAASASIGLIQYGGSAETQPSIFGRSRRDVLNIVTSGSLNRGMNIGNLTTDSVIIGTNSTAYAYLVPTGNWQFSPPATFNIYNRTTTTYNVGIGTTTPLSFLSQTMTDRRVVNITDSVYFAGYYAQGATGAAMTLGHINGGLNQKYFQMYNSGGTVSFLAVNDIGSAIISNPLTISLPNGSTNFGSGSVAAASAVVQMTSTTKGFLPPVMTTAQRNAISSPATGLEIFCSDCTATDASTGVKQSYNGSTWKNHW